MDELAVYIDYTAKGIELIGIVTLVTGTIYALCRFLPGVQDVRPRSYKLLR